VNEKTHQVYIFIREHIERKGYAPTQREIAMGSHISSDKVTHYLSILAMHELIEYTPGKWRGITLK
jgi:SOS-response transcriptional repressor LexA